VWRGRPRPRRIVIVAGLTQETQPDYERVTNRLRTTVCIRARL